MGTFKSYKDLDAWKKSRELVKAVYEVTKKYPKDEEFGLKLQMRRAAISVLSNIAEGQGRQHKKEAIQFMYISRGSLNELEAQIEVSSDLGYVTNQEIITLIDTLEDCRKLLSGFINYLQKSELS